MHMQTRLLRCPACLFHSTECLVPSDWERLQLPRGYRLIIEQAGGRGRAGRHNFIVELTEYLVPSKYLDHEFLYKHTYTLIYIYRRHTYIVICCFCCTCLPLNSYFDRHVSYLSGCIYVSRERCRSSTIIKNITYKHAVSNMNMNMFSLSFIQTYCPLTCW